MSWLITEVSRFEFCLGSIFYLFFTFFVFNDIFSFLASGGRRPGAPFHTVCMGLY